MSSCSRVCLGIVLAWVVNRTPATADAAAPPKPNVLWIVVDDLRPALACYGDPVAVTPHLDRLAGRSTLFLRAYCQLAVCSPSRASALTGRRPDTLRVWDLQTHFREVLPDVLTLPQHFRNHGYWTASIGKVLHGSGVAAKDPPSWSSTPRYDVSRRAEDRYALPVNLSGSGLKRNSVEAANVSDETYLDGQVCRAAIEALTACQAREQPFFLAVGFRKPHLPFCAPLPYWNLYQRAEIPLPMSRAHPVGAPELATRSWRELEGYDDIPANGQLSDAKVRELRHGYYACVSYIDALIGNLLAALEARQLDDNTIVVLWGDHGYHLGEQGLWTKANNYELATRIPLIIRVPQISQTAAVTEALVELIDLYPTLVDLCGLAPPSGLEGISLAPLLDQPQRPWKQAAYSQFPRHPTAVRYRQRGEIMGHSVRTQEYRYVEWRRWRDQSVVARELYALDRTSHESQNIIAAPTSVPIVPRLAALLAAVAGPERHSTSQRSHAQHPPSQP